MADSRFPLELERYSKQILFAGIGVEGQRRLKASRVLICGCGALGGAVADGLTRAGVGFLRIVDRDFVELTNLQRQVLFDEADVASGLPKAICAANRLRSINSTIQIEPQVLDLSAGNILQLAEDVNLIIDGTDNFEARFLINDAALELGRPWIYAGCIGSHGQVFPIFPDKTACLRCLIGDVPGPGQAETCDTAGVLGPAIAVVAALEVALALRILASPQDEIPEALSVIDIWEPSFRRMNTARLREQSDCPACVRGERSWLRGDRVATSTVLCGRNAVQISPASQGNLNLSEIEERLRGVGHVKRNPYLLKFEPSETGQTLTLFPNGRAIIQGTDDPVVARSFYARYVGS